MNKIVIIGAGFHGRVIASFFSEGTNKEEGEVAGFIDDDPGLQGKVIDGFQVLGKVADMETLIQKHKIKSAIVGFSAALMQLRSKVFKQIGQLGLQSGNVIHQSAIIHKSSNLGVGIFIGEGVIISTSAKIGDNSVLSMGSEVGHHSQLRENVWLSGGVCLGANVSIDEDSMIGFRASVLTYAKIGKEVSVGVGTTVIGNLADGTIAVNVPRIVTTNKRAEHAVFKR